MKNLINVDKREKGYKGDPFKGFRERGEKIEDLFQKIAEKRGWKVSSSTPLQNMREHWDKQMQYLTYSYLVEVKGQKKAARWDAKFDDDWIWIELRGVADAGWLHGKADLIAFELYDRFVMIERLKLIELVKKLVDLNKRVYHPHEAKYCVFSRPTRNDLLTKIRVSDVEKEKWNEWSKR